MLRVFPFILFSLTNILGMPDKIRHEAVIFYSKVSKKMFKRNNKIKMYVFSQ